MKNSTPFSHETPNPKKINSIKLLNYNDEFEATHVPSHQSVKTILAYSKALELNPSKRMGFIENVLN